MEWMIPLGLALMCFVIGYGRGRKSALSGVNQSMSRHFAGRAEDRAAFLYVASRELANLMIWKDPDRYLSLYKALLAETDAFKSWKDDALQAKYDEISKRYPQYSDFDVLGVRPYVLYPSAAGSFSYDDLAGFYSDIVRFVAILKASNEHWKNVGGLTAQELQHLEKYVRRLKDTKFKLRLRRAIEDFYTWRSGREQANDGSSDAFDRNGYVVSRVRHFAENRYGVRLKDTNEFGLYGFFVHDNPAPNGDVDISYSYYRSDPSFEKEIWLDVDGAVYDYFDGSGE